MKKKRLSVGKNIALMTSCWAGVVLKKAKKIANGKGDANLSLGSFVDTLVICPDDLVQVIAKVGLVQYHATRHCLVPVFMIAVLFSAGSFAPP